MRLIRLTFRWVLSALFMLLGPIYAVGGMIIVISALKAKSWPSVIGTVVSSTVAKHSGKGVSYSPEIKYQYRVGHTAYEGTKIWLLDFAASEERARTIVADFSSGSSVSIFYEPSSPDRSILKPGTNWFMFATSGIGLITFVVGIALCPVRGVFRKNGRAT
jgi:Protein of unknown function (DUF3592)